MADFTNLIRALASKIPANDESRLSMLNIARGGLNSAANWLDWKPEVGPDTLAPLGLAGMNAGLARGAMVNAAKMSTADWVRSKLSRETGNPVADAAMRDRMNITPMDPRWEESPGISLAYQPLPYPRYDYQVFGDKGRWMNDPLPSVRVETEGRANSRDLRESSNAIASARGEPAPWQTTDPFVKHDFALSDAGRSLLGRESPPLLEPGYGAQPGLPQYPRIPSHWVPENNPAKFTLRGPVGRDNPTFTGDSLEAILEQIARTELKPSDRSYLEALARQKFGPSPPTKIFADQQRASLPGTIVNWGDDADKDKLIRTLLEDTA